MKKLNLRKDTLLISSRKKFYRVVLFTESDIILTSLYDGSTLSMRNCLVGQSPSAEEIYELFLYNFRPAVYQVGEVVKFYGKDTEFKILKVSYQNTHLVFDGIVDTFYNGIPKVYQTTFSYSQLMNYNTQEN